MTGIEPAPSAWESREPFPHPAHPRSPERVGNPYEPSHDRHIPLTRARIGHEHLTLFDSDRCDRAIAVQAIAVLPAYNE